MGVKGTSPLYAVLGSSPAWAVYGEGNDIGCGVYGVNWPTPSAGGNYGILGTRNYGVYGFSPSAIGLYGVYGESASGWAVYGKSTSGYAGYFQGNVRVSGTLSKGGGSFMIDHPLDPENKYLYHSFVESPDMMNIYNGIITLDANGEAIVQLPSYFQALNSDYRYQLTCIGGFAPVYIAEEITGNTFKIAGGKPGMKVSWQVTGIRQDPFAKAHRIIPEVEKPAKERGKYLHPKEYGMSESMGVDYEEYHKMQDEMKAMEERDRLEQEKMKALEEQHRLEQEKLKLQPEKP